MKNFDRMSLVFLSLFLLSGCRVEMKVINGDGASSADKVTSASNTINCTEAGGDCTQTFQPAGQCKAGDADCTSVGESGFSDVYAAVPQDGNTFGGWGGRCGLGASFCVFTVSQADAADQASYEVEANFTSEPMPVAVALQRYNYKQQRVRKADIRFVYDLQGHLMGEYRESDNAPIREYIWVEDHLLAQYDYTQDAANPRQYYYVNDHLGTPQYMMDRDGNPVYELAMAPFGENYGEYKMAGIVQPIRFAGQYYDVETGMHQNWHRDYAPNLGRYLQSDPIGLNGGMNTYAYVFQNPVMFLDPLGLNGEGALAWALPKTGDTDYQWWDPNPNTHGRLADPLGGRAGYKCNAFVWDGLGAGGDPPGRMPDGRIPSAGDWENGSVPGYRKLGPNESPKPGDVVSMGGHVGLFAPLPDGSPGTVSAGARWSPVPKIVHNDWGFRPGDKPTIQRCECDDGKK